MTCHNCRIEARKFGKRRNGLQRFQCQQCRKTFTEPHERPLNEMRLAMAKAETILKLLVLAGERCEKLMGRLIANVPVKDVECDEI